MKKQSLLLFTAMVAVAAVVGCRKDMLGSNDPLKGGGISFSTYVGGSSKGVSRDKFIAGDAFEVVGYSADTPFKDGVSGVISMPATARLLFTDNDMYYPAKRALVRSSALGEGLEWTYMPLIYWPSQGNASFAAFSPAASKDTKITAPAATVAGIPSLSFEVFGGSKTYDKASLTAARLENIHQVDLLHSMSLDIAAEPAGGVELDFRHALTKVRFSVKGAQDEGILRIISVTLTGVINKGTMELIYNNTAAANIDYLGGWTTSAADTLGFPVVLSSVNAAAVGAGKMVSVVDDHEALLMVPQKLTNVKAHVVYAHSLDGGLTWQEYVAGDGATELPLATSGVPYWKPNMSVNYVMEVNPGLPVLFTAAIEPWDNANDQYAPVFDLGAGPSTVTLVELEQDDVVTTDPLSAWITIEEVAVKSRAVGVATPLDKAYTVAARQNYLFKATENTTGKLREAKILITRGLGDFARVITLHVRQLGGNYVEIGDLRWAVGNLVVTGSDDCAIGNPTDNGLYFHFGSLVGWSGGATGDGTGTGSPALAAQVKPTGYTGSTTWPAGYYTGFTTDDKGYNYPDTDVAATGIGDPCRYYLGGTWRTPTAAEYLTLVGASGANTDKKVPLKVNGYELVFPGSGIRRSTDGSFVNMGVDGNYWSSSINSSSNGYGMYLYNGGLNPNNLSVRPSGFPVRCVQPVPEKDYVVVNGLKWATGNLVAKGSDACKIGKPEDGGLYFHFGGLVGWTGGATGDGTGTGTPVFAAQVKPTGYGGTTEWATAGRYLDGTTDDKGYNYPATDAPTTGIGDPCRYYLGGTWRTPTAAEYLTLIGAAGANTNKGVPLKVNNYELYFPASGGRNPSIYNHGTYIRGMSSSSAKSTASEYYNLMAYSGSVFPNNPSMRNGYAFPVRCVSN